MKTELDISYIFIRYITVTLQRQANIFYNKHGKIFSHESQELTEFSRIDQSGELSFNRNSFTPEELLETNFQNEQLYFSLSRLTDEELLILNEKYLNRLSDAAIGEKLNVSSQMISKKKRKAFGKLKKFLSN